MTTQNKIDLLGKAMELKKRDNGEEFYCFTDTAPEELRALFLDNYEVRDLDYEIFSRAIDEIMIDWTDSEGDIDNFERDVKGKIEDTQDFASIWTSERLAYLSVHNEDEIKDKMDEYGAESISNACAWWYDDQVKNAIDLIITKYLNL